MDEERTGSPFNCDVSASPARRRIGLRKAFLTGLAALLPTAVSLVIVVWAFGLIYDKVAEPINRFIIWILDLVVAGDWEDAEKLFRHTDGRGWVDFSFAGFVVALVLVFIVGLMLLTFVGRRLYRLADHILARLPILKFVYPHVKQLTELIFSEEKAGIFGQVVAVEYPRLGVWSLGFVTGDGLRTLCEKTGLDLVTVFVPSSPTPFTGYAVTLPRKELIELPITVDEAVRFVMSGGVLNPQKPADTLPPGAAATGGEERDEGASDTTPSR